MAVGAREEKLENDWSKVATFGSGFDADIARAVLEAEQILVQVRGHQVGMFGPSFHGPVMGGVDLYVPTAELDRARELIGEEDDEL
jgi:hypothetical protein